MSATERFLPRATRRPRERRHLHTNSRVDRGFKPRQSPHVHAVIILGNSRFGQQRRCAVSHRIVPRSLRRRKAVRSCPRGAGARRSKARAATPPHAAATPRGTRTPPSSPGAPPNWEGPPECRAKGRLGGFVCKVNYAQSIPLHLDQGSLRLNKSGRTSKKEREIKDQLVRCDIDAWNRPLPGRTALRSSHPPLRVV